MGFSSFSYAAQTEIEREVRQREPRIKEVNVGNAYVSSDYEYSWIKEGSRKGYWRVLENRVTYVNKNFQSFYVDSTGWDRLGVRDYSLDFGAYIKIKEGYIHCGGGFDPSGSKYLYNSKGFAEIEYKLINTLFLHFQTKYLHYSTNDVYMESPGLVYYFGDNYVGVDYGIGLTESRGAAQFGIVKGNFALTERVHLWLGAALGERLFDIFLLKASKQYGSIFFGGTDIALAKNITCRLGGSYSKERPSFIKRSVEGAVIIKF